MQSSNQFIALSIALFLFCSGAIAQNTYIPDSTGYVNFNVGYTTLPPTKSQAVSLIGCNTCITLKNKFGKGPDSLNWNQANQVLPDVPFGRQIDIPTRDTFHISKYYIASPPVFKHSANATKDSNTLYDIGLVTPDAFAFNGKKNVQMVYLDYSILKPMYIKYFPIEFDSTFQDSGISFLPFKVECNDFPWIDTNGVTGAQGASGIGSLTRDSTNIGKLFLPYYYVQDSSSNPTTDSTQKHLNCVVTILNDILFHYEAFFVVNGVQQTFINLKDYNDLKPRPKISFHCIYRKELPSGCKEAKRQSPYKK